MHLHFYVNGKPVEMDVPKNMRLIDILRNRLNLTGVKESCSEGECGACTVLINNNAQRSCLITAAQLMDKHILTIEGLMVNGKLDIIQQCFIEEQAVQCGYCTPGMIMTAKALLLENDDPSEEDIRLALSKNICRCSSYAQIIRAIQRAAIKIREMKNKQI